MAPSLPPPPSSSLAPTHGGAQRQPFLPNWRPTDSTRARCAEEEVTERRPGWVPPETAASARKVASWVSARPCSGGDHGSGEAGVQREPGSPVLAVPRSREPAELREARAEGEERGRAGSHSPRQMERGGPLSAAAAPALSARLLQPRHRRAPGGSPTVRLRLEPGPHPYCPRRSSAPSPAPSLARGPPPAAAREAGEGGGQRAPGNRTGDRPSKTQTKRQPHLSSPAPAPPAWSLVPGAAWPSRRAPALQGPGRSRSGSSLLQG